MNSDVISRFKAGDASLEDLRAELQKLQDGDVSLYDLAGRDSVLPEDPKHTAKGLEFGIYLQTLHKANKFHDENAIKVLQEWRTKSPLEEGTDSEGGYTVPDDLSHEVFAFVDNASPVLTNCRHVTIKSDTRYLPVVDSKMSVSWTAEEASATESEPTFERAELNTERLDAYSVVSNELIEDSAADIVSILVDQFVEQSALKIDSTIFNGDGSASACNFSGVFTAAAGYSEVFAAGSTNFSEILVGNLIDLYHRVPSYARETGMFIMHGDTKKYLEKEQDSNGAYRWNPYQANPRAMGVGGYPIYESTQVVSTSAAGTAFVMFGNFHYLAAARRKRAEILHDPFTKATSNQTVLVFHSRWAFAYIKSGAFARLMTAAS